MGIYERQLLSGPNSHRAVASVKKKISVLGVMVRLGLGGPPIDFPLQQDIVLLSKMTTTVLRPTQLPVQEIAEFSTSCKAAEPLC
jgi:hypothetical protein